MPAGFTPPLGRTKPWGTGHAVYACRHACREPFAVINADDFYGRASFKLLADSLRDLSVGENRYCLVAFILRNTLSDHGPVSRGVCRAGEDDLLRDVVEHHQVERTGSEVRGFRENNPVHSHRRGTGVDEPLGIHADRF